MPTILKVGIYRFFFYAGDRNEPPHVHVESQENIAKFWLDPVRLHYSKGYNRKEIGQIHKLVEDNQEYLLGTWDEYFND